jgi:hypothetical protein
VQSSSDNKSYRPWKKRMTATPQPKHLNFINIGTDADYSGQWPQTQASAEAARILSSVAEIEDCRPRNCKPIVEESS